MHIREGGSILSLALINLCIILIVVINNMVELGYTQAVDVKLVADSQDNRKGHHSEDNNIYLNDANLNNTKDLATTLGHETSHAIDNYYNYIWIGKRFFQSFLRGFTIAISARTQILTLALINLCIIGQNR
jgi:hypothetical protein